jgi:UDP-glucose 4-epimerase
MAPADVETLRRALVTGAHGFIGRHLARHLAANGWEVTGLGHGHWPREEWAAWGLARWIPGNVDAGTLGSVGTQAVAFHCAGGASVRFAIDNPHEDFARTVASTAALLEWARTGGPHPAIVLVSSAGVYGNTGSEPVREDRVPRPESVYAAHKLMAEDLCRLYGRHFSVRTAIVRLFSVYGPGLRKQLLWDACNRLSKGELEFAGSGREARDWVHVFDAARLLAIAADHAGIDCPVVNGGTGNQASVAEVVTSLAAGTGSGAPRFSGKARMGDPDRLVADPSRARRWGWAPAVGWRDGVAEYRDWFSRSGR